VRHRSLVPSFLSLSLLPISLLSLSILPATAFAADWQQPTPEELKMAAEPSAPNADAIYPYREDVTDNKNHMEAIYVRLKVFRDEGKKYGDVEITGSRSQTSRAAPSTATAPASPSPASPTRC
jgi:hypothetical protein